MTEQSNAPGGTPDMMQLWRDWLTQTERQLNAFFSEALKSEGTARNMGGYLEMHATMQRMMADFMQRYLEFVNMPSRRDVLGLGETLASIEGRISKIEETLQVAAEAVDGSERNYGFTEEPRRTRQPATVSFGEQGTFAAPPQDKTSVIPEELRR